MYTENKSHSEEYLKNKIREYKKLLEIKNNQIILLSTLCLVISMFLGFVSMTLINS